MRRLSFFGARKSPTGNVIEFLKFKHNLVPGLFVDDHPYKLVISINGVEKTAKGDLGHMLTQEDFNNIFKELTGLKSLNSALTEYKFIYTRNFIRGGGDRYVPARSNDL